MTWLAFVVNAAERCEARRPTLCPGSNIIRGVLYDHHDDDDDDDDFNLDDDDDDLGVNDHHHHLVFFLIFKSLFCLKRNSLSKSPNSRCNFEIDVSHNSYDSLSCPNLQRPQHQIAIYKWNKTFSQPIPILLRLPQLKTAGGGGRSSLLPITFDALVTGMPNISAGPFCRQFSAIFRSKVEEEEAAVEALW